MLRKPVVIAATPGFPSGTDDRRQLSATAGLPRFRIVFNGTTSRDTERMYDRLSVCTLWQAPTGRSNKGRGAVHRDGDNCWSEALRAQALLHWVPSWSV